MPLIRVAKKYGGSRARVAQLFAAVRPGGSVMESLGRFITWKLTLKVNQQKSAVA